MLHNKHIPSQYLRSAKRQRLALLQGLMDTDGHCTKRGQCEFTTTSERLRDGVLELIRSLGWKPTWKKGNAILNGIRIGNKYRIQFWPDQPVFRLSRKATRQQSRRPTRSQWRQIVSVEPVSSVPMRCIAVDSPSHLYLAGESMVPTHNTALGQRS